ncbi:MAG TPA: hypothetical protein VFL67_02670 [Mycobacterium sp.]|nr:hypothetical protein [Mycobacterium sp.]
MYAVAVHVTINDAVRARELLDSQVVPAVSAAPGFRAAYWTWPTDAPTNGLSLAVFDSEDNARAVAQVVPGMASDAVTMNSVEVREVVASA